MIAASVIIRTKNEGAIFKEVLQKLKNQTFQDFEVIVVDDNSIDGTNNRVFEYFSRDRARIITVPKGKFTHPYSCNLGAKACKGKYLVYLNGHSIPISNSWLEDGLKNFSDSKVAGVFAFTLVNPKHNLFTRIYGNINKIFHPSRKVYRHSGMGIMATTNAIILKSLWQKYPFNEQFEAGGEDGDWAKHWVERGYILVHDPKFRVYHSHNWTPISLFKEYLKWRKMAKPSKLKN